MSRPPFSSPSRGQFPPGPGVHVPDLVWVALLVLVTFGLRVWDLTARSLWLDESFTLLRLNDTWPHLFSNIVMRQGIFTIDLNPPLYFALLKAWTGAATMSEFSLKLFSAFASVLLVPLTYVLARRMGGRVSGFVAAPLAVLCGAYQWYGAELRMYMLVACFGALSMYALYRAWVSRSPVWGMTWLGTSVLGLFTHFSFLGLLLGELLVLGGVAIGALRGRIARDDPSGRRQTAVTALGALATGLIVLVAIVGGPTLARAWQLAHDALTAPQGQMVSPLDFGHETLNALMFGLNASDPTGDAILTLVAICAGAGAVLSVHHAQPGRSRSDGLARLLLAAGVLVPFVFWLVLSRLIPNQPSFRYVIFIFPLLHTLIARCVAWLSAPVTAVHPATPSTRVADTRVVASSPQTAMTAPVIKRAAAAGAALVLFGASFHGLVMAFARTPTVQDDWRSFGTLLRSHWQPGDILVLNLNTPEAIMPLVIDGIADRPGAVSFARDWLMTPIPLARTRLSAHAHVWYANTGGDGGYQNGLMRQVFEPFALKARHTFASRTTIIELLDYEPRSDVHATPPEGASVILDAAHDRIALAAYGFRPGSPYAPFPTFILDAYWRRANDGGSVNDPGEDLAKHALTIRLTGADGQTWWDWSQGAQLAPAPVAWTAGALYHQSYVVPVPAGLPLQPYTVELQVHAGDKGEVVQAVAQPATQVALACCLRVATYPGQRWRASDVSLAKAEYSAVIQPGQTLPVALTWRALGPHTAAWQTELRLEGVFGGVVDKVLGAAGVPSFGPPVWPAGELVRDQQALAVPYSTPAGWYRLSLNRYRDGHFVDGTLLGLVQVEDYPHTPVATEIQQPLNARVGELSLLGMSVRGAFVRGATLDVVTHWRVDRQPQRDGKLFLHIIGPDGKPVAQDDNLPLARTGPPRSTLTYRSGDGIDQVHRVTLRPDLPAGDYTLFVGIYDSQGEHARWPAQQDGQSARDDLVKAGQFTLR